MTTSRPIMLAGIAILGLALAGCGPVTTPVTVQTTGTVPWIAVQDGAGSWQALSGSVLTVGASGRYGVAWECVLAGTPRIRVLQTTVAEMTTVDLACPSPATPGTTHALSGSVTNIPAGDTARVYTSNGSVLGLTSSSSGFNTSVDGPTDTVIAISLDGSGNPGTMVVKRDDAFTADVNSYTLDLQQGKPFTVHTLKAQNVPSGGSYSFTVTPYLQGGAVLVSQGSYNADASLATLPDADALPGDRYLIDLGASVGGGPTVDTYEVVQHPGATVTVPLADPLGAGAGVQSSGTSTSASWGGLTFAGGQTLYEAAAGTSAQGVIWTVHVSAGWLGTAASYAFPDLSATPGWDAAWTLQPPSGSISEVTAWNGNVGVADLFAAVALRHGFSALPDGSVVLSSRFEGGVTP